MLTKEQIKNLKPGDPIVINTTFAYVDKDDDIWFYAPTYNCNVNLDVITPSHVSLPSKHGTSLSRRSSAGAETEVPTPKYDPTRLFRKGDVVQPRSGKTVLASEYGFVTFHELAGQYEVNEDEARGTVTLIVNGYVCFVSAFALELVTAVEEIEPFGVRYSPDRDCAEVYHRRYKNTVDAFYCKCGITREQAEEHAEAEDDRLNAEWRERSRND